MPTHPTMCQAKFRFLNLDKLQAITLSREVPHAEYRSNQIEQGYIGEVALKEDVIEDLMAFFVRQQIPLSACDIALSINSDLVIGEWQAPPIVNHMLKHIDCPISILNNED